MALVNPVTGKDYVDNFSELSLYQNILFNAGVNLQQREMNELLSLVASRIKRIGQTLYNDGSIIRNGGLIINGTSVRIPPTDIFIAGIVHNLPDTTLTITRVGTEVIGVKLKEEIFTYLEDPTLLDPVAGPNYGLPGADRLKITPMWTINDALAYPVYVLENGSPKIEKTSLESDPISAWLARRTNDESGSYTVSGLTGSVIDKDSTTLTHITEAGTAYVMGWEIKKPSPTKQDILKSQTSKVVTNETKTYTTGTTKYALNSQPVKQITQLTAQVQKTFTMTRGGTPNTNDAIPSQYTPVSSIVSITGYTATTDYTLNGNNVSWAPAGAEPSSGGTYSITLIYTKTMVQNTDYQLITESNVSKVQFLAADLPVNNTTFQTTYDFYLERRDIFYLTRDGDVKIVTGTPGQVAPLPPFPIGVLILGDIYLPPNSAAVVVTNYDPKRLTMSEIRNLRDRLDNLEYNMAVEDLDNAAQLMDPATAKKGIFTDGFLNRNKMDEAFTGFGCAIDPDAGELMASFTSTTIGATSNATGTAYRFANYATKPFTEIVGASQLKATQLMNINPYAVYTNVALVYVAPNQDNWVTIDTVVQRVFRWWNWWHDWFGFHVPGTNNNTPVQTRILLEAAVPTMRQRTLTLYGSRFVANSDNIKCTFDGISVNLTGIDGTAAGTQPGTVKANAQGNFTATFTIPANVPTGTREIVVWNEV